MTRAPAIGRPRRGLAALLAALLCAGAAGPSVARADPPRAREDPPAAEAPAPAPPVEQPGAEPPLAEEELVLFVREGCRHCAAAEAWLSGLVRERPGLRLTVKNLSSDSDALAELEALARASSVALVAAPTLALRGTLVVGWAGTSSEERVRALLASAPALPTAGGEDESCPVEETEPCEEEPEVTLPLFGRVRLKDVGLPLFTVVLGLVDGFNPCAMWVLLFLLSILVNLKSRARMLLVAGTFVLISGLVYFAFMAAWLNFFLVVGLARGVQLGLGVLALLVGAVHVKDFFAFHRGVTLSIPESAKPGIYERVRRVVSAEHLGGAMAGVVTLAVLVNMVELLCTAGLPAIYTSVLSRQGLPTSAYYGYIALYQVFYMLDDALMLLVAVVTLSRHRLQERGGRWLKLLSGLVTLLLGALLVLRPEWLMW